MCYIRNSKAAKAEIINILKNNIDAPTDIKKEIYSTLMNAVDVFMENQEKKSTNIIDAMKKKSLPDEIPIDTGITKKIVGELYQYVKKEKKDNKEPNKTDINNNT